MFKECAEACADEPCEDLKEHCGFWHDLGECDINPGATPGSNRPRGDAAAAPRRRVATHLPRRGDGSRRLRLRRGDASRRRRGCRLDSSSSRRRRGGSSRANFVETSSRVVAGSRGPRKRRRGRRARRRLHDQPVPRGLRRLRRAPAAAGAVFRSIPGLGCRAAGPVNRRGPDAEPHDQPDDARVRRTRRRPEPRPAGHAHRGLPERVRGRRADRHGRGDDSGRGSCAETGRRGSGRGDSAETSRGDAAALDADESEETSRGRARRRVAARGDAIRAQVRDRGREGRRLGARPVPLDGHRGGAEPHEGIERLVHGDVSRPGHHGRRLAPRRGPRRLRRRELHGVRFPGRYPNVTGAFEIARNSGPDRPLKSRRLLHYIVQKPGQQLGLKHDFTPEQTLTPAGPRIFSAEIFLDSAPSRTGAAPASPRETAAAAARLGRASRETRRRRDRGRPARRPRRRRDRGRSAWRRQDHGRSARRRRDRG